MIIIADYAVREFVKVYTFDDSIISEVVWPGLNTPDKFSADFWDDNLMLAFNVENYENGQALDNPEYVEFQVVLW